MCKIVSLIVREVVSALFSVLEPGPAGPGPGPGEDKMYFFIYILSSKITYTFFEEKKLLLVLLKFEARAI